MLEVNQPANLIYFFDRLDHCKLDLNYIPEFTGIREAITEEIKFRPDRQKFEQIEYEWGSVLVTLAYYARILCAVFLLHISLKILLALRPGNKSGFFKAVETFKNHISRVFYVRYLIEIYMFLWLGVLIEIVSTQRDSSLQKLSLAF